jgi:LysM repeat protein
MTRDFSTDTQEIFGEMQEDLARTKANVRRSRNSDDSGSPGKSLLVWGFIAIILILLIVLLFRGGDKAVTEELNILKTRVEQMEKKAAALDAASKRVDAVDGQIKGLQQSVSKVEGTQRSLAERIDKLVQKAETPSAPPAAQKKLGAQPKLHEVRPGETASSIARKYNLSLEQFLKLNHMTKKDILEAGKKVVVAP